MIAIINYGLGNLESIHNMLRKIQLDSIITSDPEIIKEATHIILPGVGSFDHGMKSLHELGLMPIIEQQVLQNKIPLLGICLGMQLLCKNSEEGNLPGLGWIDAKVVKFSDDKPIRIPHIGWNTVIVKSSNSFVDLIKESEFYFVHSYHVVCNNPNDIVLQTNYHYDFTSMIQHENICGVQFHPEKSHKYGMMFFSHFFKTTGKV